MQVVRNALYFSDMWLENLSVETPWPEGRLMGGGKRSSRDCPETFVRFDVMGKRQARWWGDLGYSGHSGNFGILGKGWICHHCGDYNPSGRALCLKCGGAAQEDFVKPLQFDFCVVESQSECVRSPHDGEIHATTITLSCGGDNVSEALRVALFTDQQFFKANGYNLESGYYLCQYCGFGVRDGAVCPGCSGKRVPFSEIVRLNRKCVYCGRESPGNLVCAGCGSRIKGKTFKQAKLAA